MMHTDIPDFHSRQDMVFLRLSYMTGRMRAFLFVFLFLAIAVVRSGVAFGQEDAPVVDSGKALGAGDTVVYSVSEDKVAPVKLRVSDTGVLVVPVLGNVSAAGKSCAELAAQIKRLLDAKYYYNATVVLSIDTVAPKVQRPPKKASVTGHVKSPGLVEYPDDDKLTVSQAIAKAGGADQFGNMANVTLTRNNADGTQTTMTLNLDPKKGKKGDDKVLQDGDSIYVNPKIFNFGN